MSRPIIIFVLAGLMSISFSGTGVSKTSAKKKDEDSRQITLRKSHIKGEIKKPVEIPLITKKRHGAKNSDKTVDIRVNKRLENVTIIPGSATGKN